MTSCACALEDDDQAGAEASRLMIHREAAYGAVYNLVSTMWIVLGL